MNKRSCLLFLSFGAKNLSFNTVIALKLVDMSTNLFFNFTASCNIIQVLGSVITWWKIDNKTIFCLQRFNRLGVSLANI